MDSLAGAPDGDAVDPELLALPAPPRGRRMVALVSMALVAVAALAFALSLRHDIAYFFSDGETIALGDVQALDPARLAPNTTVRIEGTPMISRAARYRRVLTGERRVVFPLAGQRTVYVETEDTPAALGHATFTGRLVTFSQLGGRMDAVERYLDAGLGLPVSGDSFLVVSGASPSGSAWAVLAALFAVLIMLLDVVLILRWFRPIAGASAEPASDEGGSAA